MSEHTQPKHCENCQTTLQGAYCHACGQSAHNPLKHLGHAIEEVFESFWHLDGRVFRSLRDTCVPGRIINQYLAGHRVRYLPPLRLFVILSLLTFFLARLWMPDINTSKIHINEAPQAASPQVLEVDDAPRHPTHNPMKINSPSGSSNAWLNRTLLPRLERNLPHLKDRGWWRDAWLSALPTTLFFLVPLFALLLRISHLRPAWTFLEHMVVALYSHSFILIWLCSLMLLESLAQWSGVAVLAQASDHLLLLALPALWLWLWVCQKRVYRQSTLLTTLKFVLIGSIYSLLVSAGALLTLVLVLFK
ncbi:hypothetical protein CO610_00190 [Lysobacteraceae bacterium NML95-0200]|nr:hypothetical protein CO610_00190 [Xanthomonadaceae bacterium NML95-0200]